MQRRGRIRSSTRSACECWRRYVQVLAQRALYRVAVVPRRSLTSAFACTATRRARTEDPHLAGGELVPSIYAVDASDEPHRLGSLPSRQPVPSAVTRSGRARVRTEGRGVCARRRGAERERARGRVAGGSGAGAGGEGKSAAGGDGLEGTVSAGQGRDEEYQGFVLGIVEPPIASGGCGTDP